MIHVQRALAALAIAAGLGSAAWIGTAAAHAGPFDQKDFPCQEDEVLGYGTEFGPDKVGCIHIDSLVLEAIRGYN